MVDSTGPRRLLFISNGHGEDSIAAEIIRRLPGGVVAEAYPVIGEGLAYANVCAVVGPRAQVASEGWRNVRWSLLRDLVSGGVGALVPGLEFCRRVVGHYDGVVVVGDIVGVALCWLAGLRNVVYLDVYKTGYGRLYWPIERWLIGRTAAAVFCRSERLAAPLRSRGIDARCAGNVMMDTITYGDYDAQSRRTRPRAVTLLPGSRQFTAANFTLQVEALSMIAPDRRPDIFLAAAGGVSLEALARSAGLAVKGPMTGEAGDGGTLVGAGLTVHVARGAAGNVIEAADLVLSQAGTATIQALGLGKPVVAFVGARDRRSRVRSESALFGEARQLVSAHAERLAEATERLLADPDECRRLGAVGRDRIGDPGAILAIVETIARCPQRSAATIDA